MTMVAPATTRIKKNYASQQYWVFLGQMIIIYLNNKCPLISQSISPRSTYHPHIYANLSCGSFP
jgi:hypothetical protein